MYSEMKSTGFTLTFILAVYFLLSCSQMLYSQTHESSLRSSIGIEKELAKGLKLELEPEFRFENGFSFNSFLVQTGLNYKVFPWLKVGSLYRFGAEYDKNSELEYSNRFAFDISTKYEIKRFTPTFRLRLCNFTDFDANTNDKSNYLRYRFGLNYNIKGIKFTPYISAELYHKLSSGLISKTRYSIGIEYNTSKSSSFSAGYSYDNKYSTLNKYHIFEIGYKFKF